MGCRGRGRAGLAREQEIGKDGGGRGVLFLSGLRSGVQCRTKLFKVRGSKGGGGGSGLLQ